VPAAHLEQLCNCRSATQQAKVCWVCCRLVAALNPAPRLLLCGGSPAAVCGVQAAQCRIDGGAVLGCHVVLPEADQVPRFLVVAGCLCILLLLLLLARLRILRSRRAAAGMPWLSGRSGRALLWRPLLL
jgi:hypothetical protein